MALRLKEYVASVRPFAAFNGDRRIPIGAAAAVAGGVALYYYLSPSTTAQSDTKVDQEADKVALTRLFKWSEFKLQETVRVSHNVQLYRFTFDPDTKLGLNVSSCILTRAPVGPFWNRNVIRPYTPISDLDAKGYFELLIKEYPNGKVSQYFASLKPGDVIEATGPLTFLKYSPNMKKKIGMVAGGSGITPMLQVIKKILKNPDDHTQISLLYANTTPDDILLKSELDSFAATHPNFKVFYTVSKPSENWSSGTGHISKDMILENLPGPGDDTLIYVCGPPGMMNHVSGDKMMQIFQGKLKGLLKDLGYTKEMVNKC